MRVPSRLPRRARHAGLRFTLLAALAGCGEAVGYTAARRAAALRPGPATWLAATFSALVLGRLAMTALDRSTTAAAVAPAAPPSAAEQPLRDALADRIEQQRRLPRQRQGQWQDITRTS